jgi:hypothetical protein
VDAAVPRAQTASRQHGGGISPHYVLC